MAHNNHNFGGCLVWGLLDGGMSNLHILFIYILLIYIYMILVAIFPSVQYLIEKADILANGTVYNFRTSCDLPTHLRTLKLIELPNSEVQEEAFWSYKYDEREHWHPTGSFCPCLCNCCCRSFAVTKQLTGWSHLYRRIMILSDTILIHIHD